MGKIIGGVKEKILTFTQEEVDNITKDFQERITELTAESEKLTMENIKVKDENDALIESNKGLNKKITELTAELKEIKDKSPKKDDK